MRRPHKAPLSVKELSDLNLSPPEFPGGNTAMFDFLRKNVKYPRACIENKIGGTIYASFVIDPFGNIKDVGILNPMKGRELLEIEVIRVITSMPEWRTGELKTRGISVRFGIPVRFELAGL